MLHLFLILGDEVARSVMRYAEQETLNHTTKAALRDFSENFAAVQDYRESEVRLTLCFG